MKAYLGGVPNSGMIILDLYSDVNPIFSKFDNYYGKPFIWCEVRAPVRTGRSAVPSV